MLSEYEPTWQKNIFNPNGNHNKQCMFIVKLRARIQTLNKETTLDIKNLL